MYTQRVVGVLVSSQHPNAACIQRRCRPARLSRSNRATACVPFCYQVLQLALGSEFRNRTGVAGCR